MIEEVQEADDTAPYNGEVNGSISKRRNGLTTIWMFRRSYNAQPTGDQNNSDRMNRLNIKRAEIEDAVSGSHVEFPKYVTQILNLANQNAQGTRPRVVGQMTDLINDFPGTNYAEWTRWYNDLKPDAIDTATDKVFTMLERMRDTAHLIDRTMVRRWVSDLVLTKTYAGLRFQYVIIQKVGAELRMTYAPSTKVDEAKGIDGYIGGIAVSVKPDSYKNMNMLRETIDCAFIYYLEKKTGLTVTYFEEDFMPQ